MNNLISREQTKKAIQNYFIGLNEKGIYEVDVVDCNAELCNEVISEIPNAYNVDGVVEELKRMSGIRFDGRNESYELNWCISTDRAVEIVKGAVKDE